MEKVKSFAVVAFALVLSTVSAVALFAVASAVGWIPLANGATPDCTIAALPSSSTAKPLPVKTAVTLTVLCADDTSPAQWIWDNGVLNKQNIVRPNRTTTYTATSVPQSSTVTVTVYIAPQPPAKYNTDFANGANK